MLPQMLRYIRVGVSIIENFWNVVRYHDSDQEQGRNHLGAGVKIKIEDALGHKNAFIYVTSKPENPAISSSKI
jgi:hypothetical protein